MEPTETNVYVTLSGLPGSGKTMLAHTLDGMKPQDIDESFGDNFDHVRSVPMRSLLIHMGYTGSRTTQELQDFHTELRGSGQAEEVFEPLRHLERSIVIVDAVRNVYDMRYLVQEFGALTMSLVTPLVVAKTHFTHDPNDEKHKQSINRFKIDLAAQDLDHNEVDRLSRDMAWEEALAEMGEDPEHHPCIVEAKAQIEVASTEVSFHEVAMMAKTHIRAFILERQAA
ncbi:MAG: hypothetical protein QG628_427 [Patescibacteria group bacterium]|nr:hypothetical protein [Patescibacteria group bacterium]